MRKRTCAAIGLALSTAILGMSAQPVGAKSALLANTGTQGGLVVHVGCGDGHLTANLYGGESFVVHGLDVDPANVKKARAYLRSQHLYGKVTVDYFNGKALPYVDNVVRLLVVSGEAGELPPGELMRVVAPSGVVVVGGRKTVKPRPTNIDEWTHYLHAADNNAVAADSVVGPPRHLQWLSDPLWTRHHDKLASISSVVTAKGRLFCIMDEGPVYAPNYPAHWYVTARDAFNGVFLWKKPISSWTSHVRRFRSGPVQLQRLLVTDGERVYVTLGLDAPVSVLDAASGGTVATLAGTEHTEEMLLRDGTLVVQVGEEGAEQALIEDKTKGIDYKTTKQVRALDTKSGKLLWCWPESGTAEIMPRTLALSGEGVFFQESGETMCLGLKDGKQRWRTEGLKGPAGAETKKKTAKKGKSKRQGASGRSMGWTYATLVAKNGVVLSCDGKTLHALDATTGKRLWQCAASTPCAKTPSVDILVLNGVVWTSPGFGEGRDLRTGNVVARNTLQSELVTAGHHHRCYRNKATERYVIEGYRGLEFMDTKGDNNVRNNWIRGVCQYGIMPANGLVYLPSHNCGCYPEAKLFGFWALSADQSSVEASAPAPGKRLEKGPAFDSSLRQSAIDNRQSEDWPTHRHDAARSGVTPASVSVGNTPGWTAQLGGRLSAPVVANGTLLVSLIDTDEIVAMDAATGKEKWRFTAGAPVDSPPTIYAGTALFGSADGDVYCVTLADGHLVWRFRAAPADRRTVVLQHVESLWPVHGSVLVVDGTAYFTAGRSSYIDGGLYLYGLDAVTGEVKHRHHLASEPAGPLKNTDHLPVKAISQNKVDYKTVEGPDKSDSFSMAGGNISDILVCDGDAIYLRYMKLGMDLEPRKDWTHHLFSTSRLLDDNEAHRSHMFYGKGDFSQIPVAYEWLTRGSYGGFESPYGKLLIYDGQRLWGTDDRKGYTLFTCDISHINETVKKDFPRSKSDTADHPKPILSAMDVHPRALIKAGEQLVVAGFPVDGSAVYEYGKPIEEKGVLMLVSAATGEIAATIDLAAPPVFDGMAAARGRLYLSSENGSVVCFAKE